VSSRIAAAAAAAAAAAHSRARSRIPRADIPLLLRSSAALRMRYRRLARVRRVLANPALSALLVQLRVSARRSEARRGVRARAL
jgi:hypothetical protein